MNKNTFCMINSQIIPFVIPKAKRVLIANSTSQKKLAENNLAKSSKRTENAYRRSF